MKTLNIPNYEERKEVNLKHFNNPEAGDYWHDCFAPCFVIIEINDYGIVTYCDKTKEVENDRWTWDLDKISSKPLEELQKSLSYYVVIPNSHKWVIDYLKNKKE